MRKRERARGPMMPREQCTFRYFWGISHLIKYKTGNAPKGHSFPPLTRQRGAGNFFLAKIAYCTKNTHEPSPKKPSPLLFFFSFSPSLPPLLPLSLSCRLSCFLGQLPLSFSIITHSPSTPYASSLREWLHFWRALEYRKN